MARELDGDQSVVADLAQHAERLVEIEFAVAEQQVLVDAALHVFDVHVRQRRLRPAARSR